MRWESGASGVRHQPLDLVLVVARPGAVVGLDHGGAAVAQADQALELPPVLGQAHGSILDAQDVHVALGESAWRAVGLRIEGDAHGGSFVVVELAGWRWVADTETGFRNPRRRLR